MSGTDAHISRRRPLWLEKGKRQNQLKLAIEQAIKAAKDRHNEFLKELGLPPLP